MTSVWSPRTTVTAWGAWPVRCFSKAAAASATCCAMVSLGFSIRCLPGACDRRVSPQAKKKPTWPNTQRHSTTSAYLLTSPPDQPGCPLPSRPTTCVYDLTGARVMSAWAPYRYYCLRETKRASELFFVFLYDQCETAPARASRAWLHCGTDRVWPRVGGIGRVGGHHENAG